MLLCENLYAVVHERLEAQSPACARAELLRVRGDTPLYALVSRMASTHACVLVLETNAGMPILLAETAVLRALLDNPAQSVRNLADACAAQGGRSPEDESAFPGII